MDRASEKASAGTLLGAAVLAAGMMLPHSAPRAEMPTDGVSLFTPGLGCGPAETLVGTSGLLARVRADAAAAKARLSERRRGASRHAARPSAPSRSARKAPRQEAEHNEPRATLLRSFYTCNAAPPPNLAEGTGWRLVGPLRHS